MENQMQDPLLVLEDYRNAQHDRLEALMHQSIVEDSENLVDYSVDGAQASELTADSPAPVAQSSTLGETDMSIEIGELDIAVPKRSVSVMSTGLEKAYHVTDLRRDQTVGIYKIPLKLFAYNLDNVVRIDHDNQMGIAPFGKNRIAIVPHAVLTHDGPKIVDVAYLIPKNKLASSAVHSADTLGLVGLGVHINKLEELVTTDGIYKEQRDLLLEQSHKYSNLIFAAAGFSDCFKDKITPEMVERVEKATEGKEAYVATRIAGFAPIELIHKSFYDIVANHAVIQKQKLAFDEEGIRCHQIYRGPDPVHEDPQRTIAIYIHTKNPTRVKESELDAILEAVRNVGNFNSCIDELTAKLDSVVVGSKPADKPVFEAYKFNNIDEMYNALVDMHNKYTGSKLAANLLGLCGLKVDLNEEEVKYDIDYIRQTLSDLVMSKVPSPDAGIDALANWRELYTYADHFENIQIVSDHATFVEIMHELGEMDERFLLEESDSITVHKELDDAPCVVHTINKSLLARSVTAELNPVMLNENCLQPTAFVEHPAPQNSVDVQTGVVTFPDALNLSALDRTLADVNSHPCATYASRSTYGDHSISGNNSVEYKMVAQGNDVAQNVIFKAICFVTGQPDLLNFNHDQINYCTYLQNPGHNPGMAVGAYRHGSYDRFFNKYDGVPEPTHIILTLPKIEDEMDEAALAALSGTTTLTSRAFTSSLQGSVKIQKKLADKMTSLMHLYRFRHNNGSLYAIGFMIMMMLQDFERTGTAKIIDALPADAVNGYNLDTPDNASDPIIAGLEKDMGDGRIFVDARTMSAKDYTCMKLITAGPSALHTQGAHAKEHIGSTFRMNAITKWVVYDDNNVVIPAVVPVTSSDMHSFLGKLVFYYGDKEAYASGFGIASTWLNGRIMIVTNKGRRIRRFFTATLEVGQVSMPRPMGHNFMWKILGREPERPAAPYFACEMSQLSNTTPAVANLASAFVATIISLGVSAVYHALSLTGEDLNMSMNIPGTDFNLRKLMTDLTTAVRHGPAPILSLACGFAPQVSDIVINPQTFLNRDYNSRLVALEAMDYDSGDLYAGAFGQKHPYLNNALAGSHTFKAWPSIYEILAPDVKMDLTAECNNSGPLEFRRWFAERGEHRYLEAVKSVEPHKHLAYAGMVINALRQHHGVRRNWPIYYQMYVKVGSDAHRLGETHTEYQPTFDEELNIMQVGSHISYSHKYKTRLIPALSRDIGEMIFNNLASAKYVGQTNAGLYLKPSEGVVPDASSLFAMPSITGLNTPHGADSGHSSAAIASENASGPV